MRSRVVVAALLLTGCIEPGDFDPVGSAASIQGSWTIDGAPPTEASCNALGAQVVQVTFLDGLRPVTHSGLRFECRVGRFDTDAPGGSGKVIAAPDVEGAPWRLRFEAVDASAQVVAVGPTITVFVPATEKVDMPATDFASATVVGFFELGGASPTAASCDEAGIDEVVIVFDDVAQVTSAGVEPCELGSVGARVVAGGTHTARLVALRRDGSQVESPAETFTVGAGERYPLLGGEPFDFGAAP